MKPKILVCGDICTDIFVRGRVVRKVNAEAPCVVLNTHNADITENRGMAGNTINNIKSLCPQAQIAELVNSTPIVKRRFVDKVSGYILLREDVEPDFKEVADINDVEGYYDFIVISDYNKGFITEEFVERLGDIYYNTPIILDTKKPLGNWSTNCIVKINSAEFEEQKCHNATPWIFCKSLIVTRGGDGCDVFDKRGSINHYNGYKVEVADVSGCGDSWASAYVIGYFRCKNRDKLYDFANYVASLAASKHGVVAIRENEVNWHDF